MEARSPTPEEEPPRHSGRGAWLLGGAAGAVAVALVVVVVVVLAIVLLG